MWTINTKRHPAAKVWLAPAQIRVNGQPVPYLRNSRFEATRAADLLARAVGWDPPVRPAIVLQLGLLADAITVKGSPEDVDVLDARSVPRWFNKRPIRADLGAGRGAVRGGAGPAHLDRGEGPMTGPGRTGTGREVDGSTRPGVRAAVICAAALLLAACTADRPEGPLAAGSGRSTTSSPAATPATETPPTAADEPTTVESSSREPDRAPAAPRAKIGAPTETASPAPAAEPHREADHLARIRVRRTR